MIFQNKYIKELGYDDNFFLFDKKRGEVDERYKPNEEGFIEAEFFNLNTTLALIIYSYLCYFKDNYSHFAIPGYFCYDKNGKHLPSNVAKERWQIKLNNMIEAFKVNLLDIESLKKYFKTEDMTEIIKKEQKIWERGTRDFIDYFGALWF